MLLSGRSQLRGQPAVSLRGDRREETPLVTEVVCGGRVGDPGPSGDLAHGHVGGTDVTDDLDRSAQERRSEISVVVRTFL